MGAWCGALALVGAGLFLWDPPAEVVSEISWHRTFSVGCLAFGTMMVFALALRGGAGYRARSLLLALLALAVGGALTWWIQSRALEVWTLKSEGEVQRVSVIGSSVRHDPRSRATTRLTRVEVAGEVVSVALGRLPRRGELVDVLVAPSRPSATVRASVPREWTALVQEKIGWWIALLLVPLTLFCWLSVPVNLWRVFAGAPSGVDPDDGRP
ncbi:MAG: hypothetical protein KDB53_06390 [Planctomycetes bacterium]|nr:hypothetical protein [Planctomycetota bacterium]